MGASPEEARAEALRQIGDPALLQKEYRAAGIYQRALSGGYFWSRATVCCLLAGALYLLSFNALAIIGNYTYDARPGTPIIGNPAALLLFGIVLFFIPFTLSALYLRRAYHHRPHRAIDITLALLIIWLGEKLAILSISALIYKIPLWKISDLMYRVNAGGDQSAPWFTMNYILLTLVGTIALGLLAGLTPLPDKGRTAT